MGDEPTLQTTAGAPHVDESLVTYTNVIYALHTLAVIIGITSLHTIVGSFVCGLPSLVAVIMNYARRAATRGTYLESHFRWQIRTFWFAALWGSLSVLVIFSVIGILLGLLGLGAVGVWIIYRVLRGWLALRDQRPMYV